MLERELFLVIPWPYSVNNLYKYGIHGVYMTKRAKDFKKTHASSVFYQAAAQGIKNLPITETVEIIIRAYPPDRRTRDDDNINKLIGDILQKGGILKNDNLIKKRTEEVYLFDNTTKKRGLEIKLKPFTQSNGIF